MNQKYFQELVSTFTNISNTDDMRDFLKGILTPQEIDEIPTRLQIAKLIKEGLPQREIAKKLGVGIATVTRGSKEVKKGRFKHL